jgi:hypothetical protein
LDVGESGHVLALGLQSIPTHDLPLCFPERACVDVPPGGAQAMYLISDVTSASPGIAAAVWAGLGVSLVLIGAGLRQHRRGFGLRAWLMLLAIALVVCGAALAWSMNGWLGEAGLVYGGGDGRPARPLPSSVVSSWPLVQSGARAGMALGATALFLMLNTFVVRRHRAARASDPVPAGSEE